METTTEHCNNCGVVVYEFSKKTAASDGSSYCVKCAEELDRNYLKRNVCSVCTRLLGKQEVKFILPSRIYSNYFFDRLPIEERLMCANCYKKVEKLQLIKQPLIKINRIRARLRKSIARRILAKKEVLISEN